MSSKLSLHIQIKKYSQNEFLHDIAKVIVLFLALSAILQKPIGKTLDALSELGWTLFCIIVYATLGIFSMAVIFGMPLMLIYGILTQK